MKTTSSAFVHAVLMWIVAAVILAAHFFLVAKFGAAGFLCLLPALVVALFAGSDLATAILFVCLFMQNSFVALFTPSISNTDYYTLMLGTVFLVTALCACFHFLTWLRRRNSTPPAHHKILRWMIIFTAIIVAYAAYGLAVSDIKSVLAYVRVYLSGVFLLMIGYGMGLRGNSGFAIALTKLIAILLCCWGILEFATAYDLYASMHVSDFFNMKYADRLHHNALLDAEDVVDFAGEHSYLNLSGDLGLNFTLPRLLGPNIHPISYAYSLAFCALVCFIARARILCFACAALTVVAGAKGPLLLLLFAFLLQQIYSRSRNTRWLSTGMIVSALFITVLGIGYGLVTRDYHVIGLLGGLNGFASNPLGYGIGMGGIMSMQGQTQTDFTMFQNYGASYAVESGFGVMLYQIGIATGVFALFYIALLRGVWGAALKENPRYAVIPIAMVMILVNSLFQEEAFSPAGWGLWLLLGGMLMGNFARDQAEARQPASSSISPSPTKVPLVS